MHLEKLYEDVAEYDVMVTNPVQVPDAGRPRRSGTRCARRGVAHITFPNDIQVADADEDPYAHVAPAGPPTTAPIYLAAAGPAARRATCSGWPTCSTPGSKVAILAGAGALHARDELLAVAERARRADRQDAAGQGGGARRLAVHHRRHRPARHQAVARS